MARARERRLQHTPLSRVGVLPSIESLSGETDLADIGAIAYARDNSEHDFRVLLGAFKLRKNPPRSARALDNCVTIALATCQQTKLSSVARNGLALVLSQPLRCI
jgi:hypothetical protein